MSQEVFTYIAYFIIECVYVFSIHLFFSGYFGKKEITKYHYIVYFIVVATDSVFLIFVHNSHIFLVSSFFLFLICSLLYNPISKVNIFATFILIMITTLCEFLGYQLTMLISPAGNGFNVIALISIRSLYLIAAISIPRLLKSKKAHIKIPKYSAIMLLIPFFSLWYIGYLYMGFLYSDSSANTNKTPSPGIIGLFIILIFLIIINVISLIAFEKRKKQYLAEQDNIALINLANAQLKQYKENENHSNELYKLKHDLKNSLLPILNYAKEGNTGQITELVTKQLTLLGSDTNIISSGNPTIDSILSYKANIAKRMNISLKANINLENQPKANDEDICVLIGNAIDNATEYLSSHPDLEPFINVFIHCNHLALTIDIENPVESEIKIINNDSVASTKSGKGHGYGLISIKNIVKKYDGVLLLSCENMKFCMSAVLYQK